MERNIFKYVWRHSRREQLVLLGWVVCSLPFYFLSLDLPKQIVNRGIQGDGFETAESANPIGVIGVPLSETLTGERIVLFQGVMADQQATLLILSFIFLFLVCVNGGFKYVINTGKGRMGERMLRRLRYELSDRLLRFRLPQIRRMKPAEVATMIKDEVEPLGGFIGDAFVTPAFLGGQAITAMVFIMVQSIWLGLIAGTIVLVQAILIPRLRVPILELGRQRQLTARLLAGRIGEVIEGAGEIHANDTSNYERAELTSRLGRIFDIRFEIFQRKFFVKFLNNFLSQLTPFIFYAGGGLLALSGRLDIGALVAVIAAYRDLPGPVKELIDWDQRRADVQIKYDQVIEQFQPTEIVEPAYQDPDVPVTPLEGDLKLSSVTLFEEGGGRLLDGVSFEMPLKAHVAVVGGASSGKDSLGEVIAGLVQYSAGSVEIGGHRIEDLRQAVLGRRIGYVAPDAYFFARSIKENLLYSLTHRPIHAAEYDAEAAAEAEARLEENQRAANATFDLNADWIDYEAAGASDAAELTKKVLSVLDCVALSDDIYRFGLDGVLDAEGRPEVAEGILAARHRMAERLAEKGHGDLVELFDIAEYNRNATLGENLLFGTARDPAFAADVMVDHPVVREELKASGLDNHLVEKGLSIAQTMVEIFADLPAGHPFFEQFSFIDADDLPEFRQIIARAENVGVKALPEAERNRLLRLPMSYIEARHRLSLIDDAFEQEVLKVRKSLRERIMREAPDSVAFYDSERYNAAASIIDNILFGRLIYGRAQAEETISGYVGEILDELSLRDAVREIGLEYQVGIGGKRLSATRRQKLALARALLKRPDLLIVSEATAVMDGATRSELLRNVREEARGYGVVWIVERPSMAAGFPRVLVLEDGRLVDDGVYAELEEQQGALKELLTAD